MDEHLREPPDALRARLHAETEAFLSTVGAILIEVGVDNRILRWNAAASEMLGLEATTAIGSSMATLTMPWRGTALRDAVERVRRTKSAVRLDDLPYTARDGSNGTLALTVSPVSHEPGTMPRIVVLGVDVSRRRSLEEHAARSLKFEALGVLAAGVAHEINSPLQFVTDNLYFLSDTVKMAQTAVRRCREALADGSPGAHATAQAVLADESLAFHLDEAGKAASETFEGVERVTAIVRSMREFSHTSPRELAPLDLNHLLQMTITLTRHEWKYSAEVETHFDPDLPLVLGCRDDLQEAFMNLLLNAAQAVEERYGGGVDRGTLRVTTARAGTDALVRIADTGTGIHPQVIAKVFDPFFTTKPVGKGTGQGLAITRTIVEQRHKGRIHIQSEFGVGTRVDVLLPIEGIAPANC